MKALKFILDWLKPATQKLITSHNAETKASRMCTCIWKHIIIITNFFVNLISWASATNVQNPFVGTKIPLKKKPTTLFSKRKGEKRLISVYFKACFMEGKKHDWIRFRQDRLQDIQTKQLMIYVYGT